MYKIKQYIKKYISVTNYLCNASAGVSFMDDGNVKLYLSFLFYICNYYILSILHPQDPFQTYSQNLGVLTYLIYATTSQTYSLLKIHTTSGYFYSIKSNFCSNTVTLCLWPESFSGTLKQNNTKFPILSILAYCSSAGVSSLL